MNFSNCDISALDIAPTAGKIARAIHAANSLDVRLDLSENDLCEKVFSREIYVQALTEIDLSLNNLTAKGAALLAECLDSEFAKVKKVDLRFNELECGVHLSFKEGVHVDIGIIR